MSRKRSKSVANTTGARGTLIYHIPELYRTVRTGIRTLGIVAAIWVSRDILISFAGKSTDFSVLVSVLADIKFAIALTLAFSTSVWAAVERHLRHKKTEYLQNRIRELEEHIDPNRSSSGLTDKGTTNPRDKVN